MALTLVGSRLVTTEAYRVNAITLTARVTLATDGWFELRVIQIPGLVLHVSRLEEAAQAVLDAATASSGRKPEEFDVQFQC